MANQQTRSARYVSLATFRRTGKEVATPVWAAYQQGIYYVFSAGDAGKVKRLRNSSRARLAKCDVRGKLLGEWHEARAELLQERGQIEVALNALRAKYGLAMRLLDIGARLTGRFHKRAYIGVKLTEEVEVG